MFAIQAAGRCSTFWWNSLKLSLRKRTLLFLDNFEHVSMPLSR